MGLEYSYRDCTLYAASFKIITPVSDLEATATLNHDQRFLGGRYLSANFRGQLVVPKSSGEHRSNWHK